MNKKLTGKFIRPLNRYRQAKSPEHYLEQRVDRSGSCWMWKIGVDRDGYGQCHASKWAKVLGVTRAHQMAYVIVNGPIPDGMMVCHTCDTPGCCKPAHLFAGTAADNNRDMLDKGRGRSGVLGTGIEHGPIVELHGKMPCEEVAKKFGISYSLVCSIWRQHGLVGKTFHNGQKVRRLR